MELWRHTLKSRSFRVSTWKTEYLHCCFNEEEEDEGEVTIDEITIPKIKKFEYLDSIIQQKGDIDENISLHIKVDWQKWKHALGVLYDKMIHIGSKGKVYHIVVRLAMLYGSKYWPIKMTQVQRLMVTKMAMIR